MSTFTVATIAESNVDVATSVTGMAFGRGNAANPPPPQADKTSARANSDKATAERSARLLKGEWWEVGSGMGRIRSLLYALNVLARVAAYSQKITNQPQRLVAKAESQLPEWLSTAAAESQWPQGKCGQHRHVHAARDRVATRCVLHRRLASKQRREQEFCPNEQSQCDDSGGQSTVRR